MNFNLIMGSKEWWDYFTAPESLDVLEKAKFYIARSTPHIGASKPQEPQNALFAITLQ